MTADCSNRKLALPPCNYTLPADATGFKKLDLSSNELSQLEAADFSSTNLSTVTYLRLANNLLTELPAGSDGIFTQLTNLATLELEGNRLSVLSQGMLAGLTQVTAAPSGVK